MPDSTKNYELLKPRQEEFYDVDIPNYNMDKIDSALKKHDDLLGKKVDLDETGKIPQEQLPELDFIPNSEKGQPNGVAPLNEDGVLEIEHGGLNANNVQQAIYNLGVRPNKNLLCNWYFVNPVNQKGKIAPDGYGNGYGIDGWKNNKITILRFNKDEGFITAFIDEVGGIILQKVPTLEIGKIYTLSVLAKNVSSVCGMGAWDGGEKKLQNGLTTHTFKAVQGTLDNGVYIIRKSQESETQASAVFYAAKLEEGSTQTLARKVANGTGIGGTSWELLETPDYSAELLKCQRYYQLYSSAENRPNSYIDCRPVMRKPDDGEITQGTIQINDVTYYYNSAEL